MRRLAWAIPVVLHAAFDASALGLRAGLGVVPALQMASLMIGFGTIWLALALMRRLEARQSPLPQTRLARRGSLLWLGGGGIAGFVGTALLGAALHQHFIANRAFDAAVLMISYVLLSTSGMIYRRILGMS